MVASENGQCRVLRLFMDHGNQVDLHNELGRHAVMVASKHGHCEVVKLLIEEGALIHGTDLSAIMSNLMLKHQECHKEIDDPLSFLLTELLLEKDANIKFEDENGSRSLLLLSCVSGNLKISQPILEQYPWAWVELTPLWDGALFLACAYGQYDIVKLLLEKGFPQDLVRYGDVTTISLFAACIGGHFKVVQLLLERAAWIDALDSEGRSALMVACAS